MREECLRLMFSWERISGFWFLFHEYERKRRKVEKGALNSLFWSLESKTKSHTNNKNINGKKKYYMWIFYFVR